MNSNSNNVESQSEQLTLTLSNPFKKSQHSFKQSKKKLIRYIIYACTIVLIMSCTFITISKSFQITALSKEYQTKEDKIKNIKIATDQIISDINIEENLKEGSEVIKIELTTQNQQATVQKNELNLKIKKSNIDVAIQALKTEIQFETITYNRLSQDNSDLEKRKIEVEKKVNEYKRELELLRDKSDRLQKEINVKRE